MACRGREAAGGSAGRPGGREGGSDRATDVLTDRERKGERERQRSKKQRSATQMKSDDKSKPNRSWRTLGSHHTSERKQPLHFAQGVTPRFAAPLGDEEGTEVP